MSLTLIIIAIAATGVSGVPALLLARHLRNGQRLATGLMLIGGATGLLGAGMTLAGRTSETVRLAWPAAGGGVLGVDALSAFFLVPIFLMGSLGSVYGLGYWVAEHHAGNARKVQLFWGLMTCGMGMLVVATHAMAFLLGWEIMALSAFFLVSAEDHRRQSRYAGLLYLIATHVGTLTLFALFCVWRWSTGSYVLAPVAAGAIGSGAMTLMFLLALIAFGLKAGIMPLHFWLPTAHANAPSHVSALLSGVVIKMGIYGIVRFLSLMPDPPAAWGGLILLLGAVSGLLGVVFAIGQHDLKQLLAYHSVENIGIILMGLGMAMLGRSAGQPEWIVLGLGGCLLHVWNHGLFKSLLFFCAGAVVHGTHTRQIDHLGGLAKSMPFTAGMFLVGAAAICGLPPLNGFVSEFLVYMGLMSTIGSKAPGMSAAVLAAPVLAMIGALALACFVKAFGSVFLGVARTPAAMHSHEAPQSMRAAMTVLALCCAAIGLAPVLAAPALDAAIADWVPQAGAARSSVMTAASLGMVSVMSVSLAGLIVLLAALLPRAVRSAATVPTWDCGYAAGTRRMQYTASSFAQMIVGLFAWALHPREHRPAVKGTFPGPSQMSTHVEDLVLDRMIAPVSGWVDRWVGRMRGYQKGLTHHYLLAILITVIVMMCTLLPLKAWVTWLWSW